MIKANESQTILLPAGHLLTLTNSSGAIGLAVRLSRLPGGGNAQSTTAIGTATITFGPYALPERFNIICTAGVIMPSVAVPDPSFQVGTKLADNAPAGNIGELLSVTIPIGNAISETSATPVNVCSLNLTPGDWDVSGVLNRSLNGATATIYGAAISPTSNTVPPQAGGGGVGPDSVVSQRATFGTTITGAFITAVGPVRISLAAAAAIYLVAADTFSAGTIDIYGTLRARRMR
ncbi:MAG: hypothetical protein QMD11_07935 [Smithella sp.]|nr:hypothetical protein [Smithella sp.]